jgi:predicted transcriptional regulator of viral defense system
MQELINPKKKYITGSELRTEGLSYYKINKLVNEGKLRKINHTTYENLSFFDGINDFYTVSAFVPEGIVCLLSAARHYELTDYIPDVIDVAIDRKARVSTLPVYPAIKLYYFDSRRMELGKEIVTEGQNSYTVFNLEKTVVDIIYYRNKVGIEETGEIVRNYIRRKDRNLNLLYEYARKLKCDKIVRTYMEVLL